jgi:dimeric dUTPase (all-alpha-NTP-PPase superfamily)
MTEIFKCVKSLKYIISKKLSTVAEESDQYVKQLHVLNNRIGLYINLLHINITIFLINYNTIREFGKE